MSKLFFIIVFTVGINVCIYAEEPISNVQYLIQQLFKAETFQEVYNLKGSLDDQLLRFIPDIMPVSDKFNPRITSGYGFRNDPLTNKKSMHLGVDIKARFGASILATADGEIFFTGNNGGYGLCIIIKHNYGFETIYGHLTLCYCKKGDIIEKGQRIGFLGSTGKSTGAHLHYEIVKNGNKIDPADFLDNPFRN